MVKPICISSNSKQDNDRFNEQQVKELDHLKSRLSDINHELIDAKTQREQNSFVNQVLIIIWIIRYLAQEANVS